VKQLAGRIEQAQGPEIKKMTGWLRAWGASTSSHDGMHMGDGMMSDQDMKKLATLSGNAFDKTFPQMMIKHHQGPSRWPGRSRPREPSPTPSPWPTAS
jgi:uncharacterized protein (DUF305 family)